ncbi:unnamed protein product [Microthlaspi erraticum]|uniref:Uncharacterized protein n=1 Tax=Microthlaspi erraticum TaxID=1685480 RepID=A0A6D2HWU8_9BRAS|nr:unnamed protein product [Microthlaspi erraticum]
MPPGAKKRKALKKKKEQEAIGTSEINKDFNGHGNDEQGSQEEGESDGNLSSPGSQGNGELWTRDPSPSPLSGLAKATGQEKTEGEDVIEVGKETDHDQDKPSNPFPENTRKAASQSQEAGASGTSVLEIASAVDSKVVISDKNEQAETSTALGDSDENKEKLRLKEAKEGNIVGSCAETSKEMKESQVPECCEEKSLSPPGPPVDRTSWLSCCGLFHVMAGSDR